MSQNDSQVLKKQATIPRNPSGKSGKQIVQGKSLNFGSVNKVR